MDEITGAVAKTIRWTFDDGTLILEPVDGKEGTCKRRLSVAIGGLSQVTKTIKTKGILHFVGTSLKEAFTGFTELETADLSAFETSQATDFSDLFKRCFSLRSVNLSSFNTTNVKNMEGVFRGCYSLTTLNISNFNTENVVSTKSMFSGCKKLHNIDLSSFNTSKVTDMSYMFNGCSSLTNLDVSNFDTSGVTEMQHMFSECSSLISLDLSNSTTGNVTNMSGMFCKCSSLTNLNLSSFDTSNTAYMCNMFFECSSLTSLDLSSFDTNNVTDMQCMFFGCSSLTSLNLSNFHTDNVTGFRAMFSECSGLKELDISNFCIKKSAYVFEMFHSTNFSVLNMGHIKSDVDFYLTGLSAKSLCHLIVLKKIEDIAKQITNPSAILAIAAPDTYNYIDEVPSFHKSFVKRVLMGLTAVTQLDFKNDLSAIKKTSKNDLTLALYKAMELTQNNGHSNSDLSGISTILNNHGVTAERLNGLNQKQVINLFNEKGLASDIDAYLNGVPLEDVLA